MDDNRLPVALLLSSLCLCGCLGLLGVLPDAVNATIVEPDHLLVGIVLFGGFGIVCLTFLAGLAYTVLVRQDL